MSRYDGCKNLHEVTMKTVDNRNASVDGKGIFSDTVRVRNRATNEEYAYNEDYESEDPTRIAKIIGQLVAMGLGVMIGIYVYGFLLAGIS